VGISRLRALLEQRATVEDLQFIIPHPFLPPRFRKISQDRNMILLVDADLTIHVRWEGTRLAEHHPLTREAAQHLVREVLRNMKAYRRELEVYSRFLGSWAEQPLGDKRYELPRWPTEPPKAWQEEAEDTVTEVTAIVPLELEELTALGGESPFPSDLDR
jgi:hypothetical protein